MQLEMFQQPVPVNIAKSVTKSSIYQHCIQIIYLIRRRVTKKTRHPEAFYLSRGLSRGRDRGVWTSSSNISYRSDDYLNFPYNFLPTAFKKTKEARVGRLQKAQV